VDDFCFAALGSETQIDVFFSVPANDIVECAGKLVEAFWHSPTEKSKPILVAQHAFIIEPKVVEKVAHGADVQLIVEIFTPSHPGEVKQDNPSVKARKVSSLAKNCLTWAPLKIIFCCIHVHWGGVWCRSQEIVFRKVAKLLKNLLDI